MLMHGMVPIKSSARCWKNNDACWYAIYLSATCKCWEISVCVCVHCTAFVCSGCFHAHAIRFRIQKSYRPTISYQHTKTGAWMLDVFNDLVAGLLFDNSTFIYSHSTESHWSMFQVLLLMRMKRKNLKLLFSFYLSLSHPIVRFLHLNSKCVCCFSVVVVRIKFQTKLALKRAKNRMRSI